MKAYPLDGDNDLLHTCYSASVYSIPRGAITHIVRNDGRQTLCGIHLKDPRRPHPYSGWIFNIWSLKDDRLGVDSIGCMRCKKSSKLIDATFAI